MRKFNQMNKKVQVFFVALTSLLFHVKHTQGESGDHTCVGIAEPKM